MQALKTLRILAVVLLLTTAASAQTDPLDLEVLWRHGQFDLARELISANHEAGNTGPTFLRNAAEACAAMHDYDLAGTFFDAYATTLEGNRDAYRENRHLSWINYQKAAPSQDDAPWIEIAQTEVEMRLAGTDPGHSPDRRLALELEYLLDNMLNGTTLPGEELRTEFPQSEVVLQAAKELLDEIAVERDDTNRLELVKEFLTQFPGCYWRHLAYRYWLYTAWHMGTPGALADAAKIYLDEYPDHPASHGAISRYYFEADYEPETGMEHARRSVELYETVLGLDGSDDSLNRFNISSRNEDPGKPYEVPGDRQMFLEYLGSRFNYGRYLISSGDFRRALEMVEPIIRLAPFTTEEEETLAPFYLVAAEAHALREDWQSSYRAYMSVLIEGDSRNRYSLQAEGEIGNVIDRLSKAEMAEADASLVPPALSGVTVPRFTDVTLEYGLANRTESRVAWGDVDRDGDPDLLLNGSVLMRNDGPDGFTDVSRIWGLAKDKSGGLFADIDNDGDLDLYATASGKKADRLYRNDGPKFTDITAVAGNPADDDSSEGAAWVDYDNDGWIDLYVANYERPVADTDGERGVGTPDCLYKNNGGSNFTLQDQTDLGMLPPFGEHRAGRGVCVADYDDDGDQDIFVSNYRLQENMLWHNISGGDFINMARLTGAAGYSVDDWWGHTIGSDWGDYDNDGDLDLFSANLAHPRYAVFSDKSQLLTAYDSGLGRRFADKRRDCGIKYEETHSDPTWFDCNNDGYLDLYLTSIYAGRRSFLYLNDGKGRFHDVTYLAGARVFNGWGNAWADMDGDGDLDLAVGSGSGFKLLRNDTPSADWLIIRLVGGMTGEKPTYMAAGETAKSVYSNAAGIGARVTVATGSMQMIREVQSGKGTTSGNELLAHFGLGGSSGPCTVTVRFPSGLTVTRTDVEPNQVLTILETEAPVEEAIPEIEEPVEPEGEIGEAEYLEAEPAAEAKAEGEELDRPGGSTR